MMRRNREKKERPTTRSLINVSPRRKERENEGWGGREIVGGSNQAVSIGGIFQKKKVRKQGKTRGGRRKTIKDGSRQGRYHPSALRLSSTRSKKIFTQECG